MSEDGSNGRINSPLLSSDSESIMIELEGIDEFEKRRERVEKVKKSLKEEIYTDEQIERKRKIEETFPLVSVIVDHLEPFILHVAFAMVFSALSRSVELLYPIYIAISIDALRGKPPGWVLLIVGEDQETSYVVSLLTCLVAFLYILQSILSWLYQAVFSTLGEGLKHSIRMELYDKLQAREVGLILGLNDKKKHLFKLLIDDCKQLESLLLKGLKEFSQLGASLVIGIILMTFINWKMTIIAVSPGLFILVLSLIYWYQVEKLAIAKEIPAEKLKKKLHNTIDHGIIPIKTFDMQISEYNSVASTSRALQASMDKMLSAKGRFDSMIFILMLVGLAGVVAVGSFWLLTDSDHSDQLTIGYYTFFLLIIPMLIMPFSKIGKTLQLYRRTIVSVARMLTFLRAMPTVTNPIHAEIIDSNEDIEIKLENIQFSYPKYDSSTYKPIASPFDEPNVIDDISLTIPPKSCIAFTGPPHCGKSALAKLFLRLYDVNQGGIFFNDINIQNANIYELHSCISLVSAEPYIFAGSIAENINYGSVDSLHRPEVLEEIKRIASLAFLDPLINSLPNGIQSILSETGSEISTGNRLLINIARAIRQNTKIVVLHSITDFVDYKTEGIILKNLHSIFKDKTVIIVSSKLSLVRQAENIFVLKEGKIVEEGSHIELISNGGDYESLWNIHTGNINSKEDLYPPGDIRNFRQ